MITTDSITQGVLKQHIHVPTQQPTPNPPIDNSASITEGISQMERYAISMFLHKEAKNIENDATPLLQNESKLHQGYQQLELSKALRATANYLVGIHQ